MFLFLLEVLLILASVFIYIHYLNTIHFCKHLCVTVIKITVHESLFHLLPKQL